MSGWSPNSHLPITKNFTANRSIHKYNEDQLTQYQAQPSTQVDLKFCCSKFSSLSLLLPKTLLSLLIFRNVQNEGQLTMQTKLWVNSHFYQNCSAQPSEWGYPSAQKTHRSPQAWAVPCSSITLCSCTQMRAELLPFLLPASQVQVTLTVIQTSCDQTAACSKHGTWWQDRECPLKWLLLHANITSSTQVCLGLTEMCPCEGQYPAGNMQRAESLSVHKDTQILILVCTHYLTELDFSTQGQARISQMYLLLLMLLTLITKPQFSYILFIFILSGSKWNCLFSFIFCTQCCDEMKLNMMHFWDKHLAPSKQEDCSRSVF